MKNVSRQCHFVTTIIINCGGQSDVSQSPGEPLSAGPWHIVPTVQPSHMLVTAIAVVTPLVLSPTSDVVSRASDDTRSRISMTS